MVLKQRQTQTDTTAVVDGRTHDWMEEYVSTYTFPDSVCSEGQEALTPTGKQARSSTQVLVSKYHTTARGTRPLGEMADLRYKAEKEQDGPVNSLLC